MLVGDDAIRENIQYSPFTKRATTPRKDHSQRAEGGFFMHSGGHLWGTAQGIGGGLF